MEVLRKSISAATLSVAFLLTACGNEGSTVEVPQQPAPVVKTLTTELVSVPNAVELTGRARAHAEAEIRPQVTGIIKERLFKEGDLVSRGQALYQIDADEYAADVRSAEAALARAQASALSASRNMIRPRLRPRKQKPILRFKRLLWTAHASILPAPGFLPPSPDALVDHRSHKARSSLKTRLKHSPTCFKSIRSMWTLPFPAIASSTCAARLRPGGLPPRESTRCQ